MPGDRCITINNLESWNLESYDMGFTAIWAYLYITVIRQIKRRISLEHLLHPISWLYLPHFIPINWSKELVKLNLNLQILNKIVKRQIWNLVMIEIWCTTSHLQKNWNWSIAHERGSRVEDCFVYKRPGGQGETKSLALSHQWKGICQKWGQSRFPRVWPHFTGRVITDLCWD